MKEVNKRACNQQLAGVIRIHGKEMGISLPNGVIIVVAEYGVGKGALQSESQSGIFLLTGVEKGTYKRISPLARFYPKKKCLKKTFKKTIDCRIKF